MQYFVRSASLSGYVELVNELGGDPIALLTAANIIPAQLNNPDNMILYRQLGDLLENSAKHLNSPTFGTALSLKQNITTIGLIGAYMCQQNTIGDALRVARRYTYMHAQGASFDIVEEASDYCMIKFELLIDKEQHYTQLVQLSLGLIFRVIQDMVGNNWKADCIYFRQPNPFFNNHDFLSVCRQKIQFEKEMDALRFPSKVLTYKPQMPINLINDIVANQFRQNGPTTELINIDVIRHAINMLLSTGDCNKKNIALSLGLHPKKLERTLQEHQTSYRGLLEETRKEIALRMLQLGDVSMTTLALNLGYSELSAFSRSFKTWFGVSPHHYKKRVKDIQ